MPGSTIVPRPALILLVVCGACRASSPAVPPLIQPGAPGAPSRAITPEKAIDLPAVRPTADDVRFVQGMVGHHAQALEMTALVSARSQHDDVKLIAQRIALSQADEIKMMQEWLASRGEQVPDAHAHHAAVMPGMLTAEEMSRLSAATGADFDRLFVELMIKHHGGALTMVEELFAHPGAGQDPELFAFASDVEADQRGEIARLAALLKELSK
jgi:uncharacterized protein (DUF305 family)